MLLPSCWHRLTSILVIYLVSCTPNIEATTIVPFTNLGELAIHCDAVVMARMVNEFEITDSDETRYRSRLKVLDKLKGRLDVGDIFETQKWEMRVGEMIRKMYGDVELEKGMSYLLFLKKTGDNLYHPICFSYYIFEEHQIAGLSYLIPSGAEDEFILVDEVKAEPLYIFKKKELITHLKSIVSEKAEWNPIDLVANVEISRSPELKSRAAPTHCTFLGSGNNFRWEDFPNTGLPIHYQSGGDGVCASIPSFVGSAISALNQSYSGIKLTNGGAFSGFTPDCGSAHGSSFRDYVWQTYGDTRRILIQFNDPCSELPNLQNCGGTLAVGGLFGFGTHQYQGEDWFSGAYGYVVINNGVGQCYCDPQDYQDLIVHELSHSLGLGHIGSSSGMANMNPFCCNSIQTLDLECMEFSYESGTILPVSLSSFGGVAALEGNVLSWTTSSEQNVESFMLESSTSPDPSDFATVVVIGAVGNSNNENHYEFIDRAPQKKSYYRLRIQDLDGSESYSEMVNVVRTHSEEIKVYPTMVDADFYIQLNDVSPSQLTSLRIIDVSGKVLDSRPLTSELNRIYVQHLIPGVYSVSVSHSGDIKTFRIQKM